MNYKIEVDYAPAYELLISFVTYTNKSLLKGIDLGVKWRQNTRATLTPAFAEQLEKLSLPKEGLGIFYLLAGCCPIEGRSSTAFLDWLESLTAGDMFELVAAHVEKIPSDWPEQRAALVSALREWNAQYFSRLDPAILDGLERDALAKRKLMATLTPVELYEEATNGIRQSPSDKLELIRIVPQYHMRPSVHSTHLSDLIISFYGCDAVPAEPGVAPVQLMRLLRCLADDSRLKMLSVMSGRSRTFTELVKLSGLSKSTLHHHLIALRAAGLLTLEADSHTRVVYSLRTETIDRLGGELRGFLKIQ